MSPNLKRYATETPVACSVCGQTGGTLVRDSTPGQYRHMNRSDCVRLLHPTQPLFTPEEVWAMRRPLKKMRTASGNEPLTWESEVVMKPIQDVAKELEEKGWTTL